MAEEENVRVMLQGQSNALGVGHRDELKALGLYEFADGNFTFDRVFIMTPDDGGDSAEYRPLNIPENNHGSGFGDFGCEFGLALRWEREKPGKLFIEKSYIDGAPIRYFLEDGKCNVLDEGARGCPGKEKGAFFHNVLKARIKGNELLKNTPFRDAAWIWVQGEGDYETSRDVYLQALENYTNSLKSSSPSLVPETATKILACQIPGGPRDPNGHDVRYGSGPDEARAAFGLKHPRARLISYTNNFNADNVHLNAKGQLQLGYDAFEKIFDAPHMTV